MEDIDKLLKKIKTKRLLVVFPHPDDEVFMAGGLIQRATAKGFVVEVISLTQGGRGQNHKNDKRGNELKRIRRVEFEMAMIELGVKQYQIWDYADGGLRKGVAWKEKLKSKVDKFRPGLVVSYGPTGVTGHPDHIAVGKWMFEYLRSKKARPLLFWPVWPGVLRRFMVHVDLREMMEEVKVVVRLVGEENIRKCRGIKSYESQLGNFSWWQRWLAERIVCRKEFFAVADYGRQYQYKYVEFKID